MVSMAKLLLDKKVAVITGAAGAIGKEIARKFVQQGACVFLADKNHQACEELADALKTSNPGATVSVAPLKHCDVSDPSNTLEVIREAKKAYGSKHIDIFYNNAGINYEMAPIDYDRLMGTMKVNFGSVLASIKHAGDEMRMNQNGGSILCTGSTTGLLGDVVPSAYGVSKAAVLALVRAAAADLASHGVRVNAISPHLVAPSLDTSVLKQIFQKATDDKKLDDFISKYVAKRVVTAVDVANAAVYLASDASKGVTGHNLVLDGSFPLPEMKNE